MFTLNWTGRVISIGAFYFKNYVHDLLRYQLNQSKHFLLFHLRFICRIDLQSYAADTRKEMDKIIFWHNREPQNYLDKGLYGILVIDWLDKYFFKSGPLEITFVIFFIPFVLLIDYTPGCFSVFFLLRRRVEGQIHPFYCDIQHYFTRWKHYLDFY